MLKEDERSVDRRRRSISQSVRSKISFVNKLLAFSFGHRKNRLRKSDEGENELPSHGGPRSKEKPADRYPSKADLVKQAAKGKKGKAQQRKREPLETADSRKQGKMLEAGSFYAGNRDQPPLHVMHQRAENIKKEMYKDVKMRMKEKKDRSRLEDRMYERKDRDNMKYEEVKMDPLYGMMLIKLENDMIKDHEMRAYRKNPKIADTSTSYYRLKKKRYNDYFMGHVLKYEKPPFWAYTRTIKQPTRYFDTVDWMNDEFEDEEETVIIRSDEDTAAAAEGVSTETESEDE